MELLALIFFALVTYIAAVYIAVKLTIDKLGARSGLFGVGIATMFAGFIWSKLVEYSAIDGWFWYTEDGRLPVMYFVLLYGFMIMGFSGIVMIAVDLLKAINEMRAWVAKKD